MMVSIDGWDVLWMIYVLSKPSTSHFSWFLPPLSSTGDENNVILKRKGKKRKRIAWATM